MLEVSRSSHSECGFSNLMSDLVSTKRNSIPIGWEVDFRYKAAVAAELGTANLFRRVSKLTGHYPRQPMAIAFKPQPRQLLRSCG